MPDPNQNKEGEEPLKTPFEEESLDQTQMDIDMKALRHGDEEKAKPSPAEANPSASVESLLKEHKKSIFKRITQGILGKK